MNCVEREVERLYLWIRAVACRMACDESDGEDLAHDTIVKALTNARRFDGTKDIKPWLMAIMSNTFKSRRRRCGLVSFCPLHEVWSVCGREDPASAEAFRSLLSLIRTMSSKDVKMRSLLLYAEGYDYVEIAARTGANVGTVKSRIYYARKRLKSLLES